MDFDKLSLELDKLNLLQIEENAMDPDPETWLFTPSNKDRVAEKEEENLENWLKGAVEKVDFRTRSALSRRLEKKKRIKGKEKKRNNVEASLSMIEEMSGESGPLSDREQQRRPQGEKENMAQRKAISEASIDSNDEEDDEEEEEYFDAPSTPKKYHQIGGRNPAAQQLLRKQRNGALNFDSDATASKNLTQNMATLSKNAKPKVRKSQSEDQPEMPKEWRNLSEIERRAKEQERELQMELMKSRRNHLSAGVDRAGISPRSRPDSASSSSSVLSGHGPPNSLATSKSVDFRTSTLQNTDQSSTISSRSNEGSLADLSSSAEQQMGQPLNARLPLPRRPTIPGKTGIPLPAPRRAILKYASMNTSPPADPAPPMDDDECF